MNYIEIFALIVLIVAATKIAVILIKPAAWLKLIKAIWKKPMITLVVSLVLTAIVLYYLLQEGMTIVSIFGVMLFIALLSATTMAVYSREFLDMANKFLKDKKLLKKGWLPLLIWIVLIIWALKELFM